jgi:hypothetical protein
MQNKNPAKRAMTATKRRKQLPDEKEGRGARDLRRGVLGKNCQNHDFQMIQGLTL